MSWLEEKKEKTYSLIFIIAIAFVLAISTSTWWFYDNIPKPGISLNLINQNENWGLRTISKLDLLKNEEFHKIPNRQSNRDLIIATWSFRRFGNRKTNY